MDLLVLSPNPPFPPDRGHKVRTFHILSRLAERHRVHLAAFYQNAQEQKDLSELEHYGIQVLGVPRQGFHWRDPPTWTRAWSRVRAVVSRWPQSVRMWDRPAMLTALRQILAKHPISVVQVEHTYLSHYLLDLPAPGPLRSLVAHDVLQVTTQRRAANASGWNQWWWHIQALKARWLERAVLSRVDCVIAMSEHDRARLLRISPQAKVFAVPNGVDVHALNPQPVREQAKELLFVGASTHYPNIDGVAFFLREVWPRLRRQKPVLHLTLVNMDVPAIRAVAGEGVTVISRVPDVVEYYRRADLCVVPLRIGSGTRLKILEAMALGVPVVSTSVGCEGLDVHPGEHLEVADVPEQMAHTILSLLSDAPRRRALAQAARHLVETTYSWDDVVARLEALYCQLLAARAGAPRRS